MTLLRSWLPLWSSLAVVLLSLLCAGIVVALLGHDPVRALAAMWKGALGSPAALTATALKAGPLLLAGLAVALAFRTGVWNIGAEGQLYAGALLATALITRLSIVPWQSLPGWLVWPLTAAVGALGGACLAAVAAWLRYRRGVSEVIATILLNFVAIQAVAWAVLGPLAEPGSSYPQSEALPEVARLPALARVHLGILLAALLAVAAHRFLKDTPEGFRWRAVGADPTAARYIGVSPERIGATALIVGGGLAGLAGAFEVMGVTGRLFAGLSPGTGYTAIAVALLARLNPLGVLAAAFFFGALEAGAQGMQRNAGVSAQVAEVVQGLAILLSALAAVLLQRGSRS